jgi:hypothetical protein
MEACYYHQTGGCAEMTSPIAISEYSFLDSVGRPGFAE